MPHVTKLSIIALVVALVGIVVAIQVDQRTTPETQQVRATANPASQPPPPTAVPTPSPDASVERKAEILSRVLEEPGVNTDWSDDKTRFYILRWTIAMGGGDSNDLDSIQPVVEPDPDRPGVWLVGVQFTVAGEPNAAIWRYFEEDDRVVTANEWAALVDRGA